MTLRSRAFARQKLCLDFVSLKYACPKGVYVAPVPDEPLAWTGVLFVRKGPYANAILRFHVTFPDDYPDSPPIVTFLQDVFHPLVTPLTTYTYSTRDRGGDTVSSADGHKLPPGGLVLKEGLPEWYVEDEGVGHAGAGNPSAARASPTHTVQLLHYIRLIFSTPEMLDNLPLSSAANPSAWHAWRSYRAKILGERARSPQTKALNGADGSETGSERSLSPRGASQQPGGARRPGEWNWTGVWEERVRKAVITSRTDGALFGGDGGEVIGFAKMDDEALASVMPQMQVMSDGR